jgi:O-succinylbenzoic acid--CoA ligase
MIPPFNFLHQSPLGALEAAYEKALACFRDMEQGTIIALGECGLEDFWGALFAGLAQGVAIAILPHGLAPERKHAVLEHLQPHALWDQNGWQILPQNSPSNPSLAGYWLIATGGSGGKVKFAYHTWETLSSAALALSEHLQGPIPASTGLPLYHMGGLMPGIRAAATGSTCHYLSPKAWMATLHTGIVKGKWVSIVPTQLSAILQDPSATEGLGQAKGIFLGSAQADENLLHKAQKAQLPIHLTYGMTETAGMVTLSTAEDFLRNEYHLGKPLPHASLKSTPEGLSIESPSLFHGYFPESPIPKSHFLAQDEALWDDEGHLLRVQRLDRFVTCGGVKIDPDWVTQILLKTGVFRELFLRGEPDSHWGQILVAYAVPYAPQSFKPENFCQTLKNQLESRYYPKKWVVLDALPRLDSGKINLAL